MWIIKPFLRPHPVDIFRNPWHENYSPILGINWEENTHAVKRLNLQAYLIYSA